MKKSIFKGFVFVLVLFVAVVVLSSAKILTKNEGNENTFLSTGKVKYEAKTIIQGEWGSGENQYSKVFYDKVTAPGVINLPAITMDTKGNIVLVDYKDGRIEKYNQDGKFISKIKFEKQNLKNILLENKAVTIDTKDNIYIANEYISPNIIYIFNNKGKFINKIPMKSQNEDLFWIKRIDNKIICKVRTEDKNGAKFIYYEIINYKKLVLLKKFIDGKSGEKIYDEPLNKFMFITSLRKFTNLSKNQKTTIYQKNLRGKVIKKLKIKIPKGYTTDDLFISKFLKEDKYGNIYISIGLNKKNEKNKLIKLIQIYDKNIKLLSNLFNLYDFYGPIITDDGIIYSKYPTKKYFKVLKIFKTKNK